MTISRFFDWLQLAVLIFMACLAFGRAFALFFARGIRVVVIDRERSRARALADLLCVMFFVLWVYEIVAHAWPLGTHVAPQPMDVVLVDVVAVKALGAVLLVAGSLIYLLALVAFGDSWRLGIDRHAHGRLVTGGIFAWTRNPIYVGLDCLAIGVFLIQGRLIFLALAAFLIGTLHAQILHEERFLHRAYGDAYRDYCAQVGRYLTRHTV